jgi:hypothetical protein
VVGYLAPYPEVAELGPLGEKGAHPGRQVADRQDVGRNPFRRRLGLRICERRIHLAII